MLFTGAGLSCFTNFNCSLKPHFSSMLFVASASPGTPIKTIVDPFSLWNLLLHQWKNHGIPNGAVGIPLCTWSCIICKLDIFLILGWRHHTSLALPGKSQQWWHLRNSWMRSLCHYWLKGDVVGMAAHNSVGSLRCSKNVRQNNPANWRWNIFDKADFSDGHRIFL